MRTPSFADRTWFWMVQKNQELAALGRPNLQGICPTAQWRVQTIDSEGPASALSRADRADRQGFSAIRAALPHGERIQRFLSMRVTTHGSDASAVVFYAQTSDRIAACHANRVTPLESALKVEVFRMEDGRRFLNVNRSMGLDYGDAIPHFSGLVRFVRHNTARFAQYAERVAQEGSDFSSDEAPTAVACPAPRQQLSLL